MKQGLFVACIVNTAYLLCDYRFDESNFSGIRVIGRYFNKVDIIKGMSAGNKIENIAFTDEKTKDSIKGVNKAAANMSIILRGIAGRVYTAKYVIGLVDNDTKALVARVAVSVSMHNTKIDGGIESAEELDNAFVKGNYEVVDGHIVGVRTQFPTYSFNERDEHNTMVGMLEKVAKLCRMSDAQCTYEIAMNATLKKAQKVDANKLMQLVDINKVEASKPLYVSSEVLGLIQKRAQIERYTEEMAERQIANLLALPPAEMPCDFSFHNYLLSMQYAVVHAFGVAALMGIFKPSRYLLVNENTGLVLKCVDTELNKNWRPGKIAIDALFRDGDMISLGGSDTETSLSIENVDYAESDNLLNIFDDGKEARKFRKTLYEYVGDCWNPTYSLNSDLENFSCMKYINNRTKVTMNVAKANYRLSGFEKEIEVPVESSIGLVMEMARCYKDNGIALSKLAFSNKCGLNSNRRSIHDILESVRYEGGVMTYFNKIYKVREGKSKHYFAYIINQVYIRHDYNEKAGYEEAEIVIPDKYCADAKTEATYILNAIKDLSKNFSLDRVARNVVVWDINDWKSKLVIRDVSYLSGLVFDIYNAIFLNKSITDDKKTLFGRSKCVSDRIAPDKFYIFDTNTNLALACAISNALFDCTEQTIVNKMVQDYLCLRINNEVMCPLLKKSKRYKAGGFCFREQLGEIDAKFIMSAYKKVMSAIQKIGINEINTLCSIKIEADCMEEAQVLSMISI